MPIRQTDMYKNMSQAGRDSLDASRGFTSSTPPPASTGGATSGNLYVSPEALEQANNIVRNSSTQVQQQVQPQVQQFDIDGMMANLMQMLQPILNNQNNQMSQFMQTQANQSNQFANQFNEWLKAQQETAAAQKKQQTQQQQQTAYNQNQQSGLNQQGGLMGGTTPEQTFADRDTSKASLGTVDNNDGSAGMVNARSRYLRDIWADKA